MPVFIDTLSMSDPLLSAVVALGDQNARFLGIYPASCYQRDAAAGRILVAVDQSQSLCGYLLFRIARGRAVIQHCCVAEEWRGQGVGAALVEAIKDRTSELFGIELHCAREFSRATAFWKASGFVPVAEKPGRGSSQRPLTRFVYDHRNSDLFTSHLDEVRGDRLLIVVDTNIAYDWDDPTRETAPPSLALRADWLADELDLRITDQAFVDADNHPCPSGRRRRKDFLRGLGKVNEDRVVALDVYGRLEALMPQSGDSSFAVDLRHIASAIAANADAFVTNDRQVLAHAELIYRELGFLICDPARLIGRIAEGTRADRYEPIRLGGSAVTRRRLLAKQVDDVARLFLDHGAGEKLHSLQKVLQNAIAETNASAADVVEWPTGHPVGVIVTTLVESALRVCAVRFRSSAVTAVLERHAVDLFVKMAIAANASSVMITDAFVSRGLGNALRERGFVHVERCWHRQVLQGLHDRASLRAESGAVAKVTANARLQELSDWEMERQLWPLKLLGASIPSYIVPIQPRWAAHLFDEDLASQTLRGGDPLLMLNTENIYYRAAQPKILSAPGRVLWYVSADARSGVVAGVRACSVLLEIAIAPAKQLYSRYRRLGVYEWRDIQRAAGDNPHGDLMGVRFGPTECFKQPVGRDTIKEILSGENLRMPPLSTAYELSTRAFEEIYKRGTALP